MKKLMIYGATGYTGRMAAQHARTAGTPLVLAGRNEAALATLASELGAQYRVFALDDAAAIDGMLTDISVILNCAGPFMRTAEILMKASIRNGVHYLDTAAELDSYQLAEVLDDQAAAAGVMLLPGGGGSVAMLGSLAGRAVGGVKDPIKMRISLHVAGGLSRGSAISASENLTVETLQRVDGKLVSKAASDIQQFDFGNGAVDCFPVTLPDLITIWQATGVPNIETFVHVTGDGFPQGDLSALPDGPSEEERLANRYQAVVEVMDANGTVARALLDTVNGYTFTAMAAAEAGRRVLEGEAVPGFQTPAGLFGAGFAETIADTTIVDV
ncbi:saccharopine dehydrogenase family protein [Asticcacaulis benevestitus]|uniref:Membrane protein n=1 Tax=Asticcacaulis benevestitus DSM 16100 = ATCC BAA-896 TaxID=1121022 RepID=V4P2I7_9CAUL|nr:saccharopine dehydrogenase NADP-binding domain-containing protein [Asticcacaulis benevestitus]ESQ81399.1 membrane protein [Asticcacaulis benevestitus DSM 16100 = ATCC BAA-896]